MRFIGVVLGIIHFIALFYSSILIFFFLMDTLAGSSEKSIVGVALISCLPILYLLFCVLFARMAEKKDRSFWWWFILTIWFPYIGVIAAILIGKLQKSTVIIKEVLVEKIED